MLNETKRTICYVLIFLFILIGYILLCVAIWGDIDEDASKIVKTTSGTCAAVVAILYFLSQKVFNDPPNTTSGTIKENSSGTIIVEAIHNIVDARMNKTRSHSSHKRSVVHAPPQQS